MTWILEMTHSDLLSPLPSKPRAAFEVDKALSEVTNAPALEGKGRWRARGRQRAARHTHPG